MEFLCKLIVGNRDPSAKLKKQQSGWNASCGRKMPGFIDSQRVPVQK